MRRVHVKRCPITRVRVRSDGPAHLSDVGQPARVEGVPGAAVQEAGAQQGCPAGGAGGGQHLPPLLRGDQARCAERGEPVSSAQERKRGFEFARVVTQSYGREKREAHRVGSSGWSRWTRWGTTAGRGRARRSSSFGDCRRGRGGSGARRCRSAWQGRGRSRRLRPETTESQRTPIRSAQAHGHSQSREWLPN